MRIFRFFALSLGLTGLATPAFAQQDPAPEKPPVVEQPIKEPPMPKPEKPDPIQPLDKRPEVRPQVDGDAKPVKAPAPKVDPKKVSPNRPGTPNLKPANAEKPNPEDSRTKLGSDPRPSNVRPSNVKQPNLKPANAEKPNPDSVKSEELRPSQNRPGGPSTLQPNQPNKPQANTNAPGNPALEKPADGTVRGVKADLSKPADANQLKPSGKVQVQPQADDDKVQKAPVPQRKLERMPAPTPGR